KQLINDILNYSRLSATDGIVADIDLNLMFDGLRSDYEVMIEEMGAEINIEKLPCIRVNPGQIRQVFQNLVSNALKFSKKGEKPVITISSARVSALDPFAGEDPNGRYCRISVRDNGIGFDEKYLENIFSLFERLNAKADYEGSGIGLAIARKIIEKHNGMLTAHSSEGKGAEFIIILPID
ncbi:MAG: PAS domain-containing sensor histidine kinase, partial [Sphingobacteriales bacterium]